MPLRPWFKVIDPREDLRDGKPLDASEFAVHLDKVRLKNPAISKDYTDPKRFFDRTFLTDNLTRFAGEAVRRLSGINTEASAVYNTMTSFGGGKTHALTLLYHLAKGGSSAGVWRDVSKIMHHAGPEVKAVPDNCAVAVFVGTEFDSLMGRGGSDGEPLRKTPWGEIAFQLGGAEGFALVAEHDATFTEPKGDVIDKLLPKDRPVLILMDEVLSYFSTYRAQRYGTKLYNFIQSLSEACRGRSQTVLVVSAPWSNEFNYTTDDVADLNRLEALLQRLSKGVALSSDADASEIVRRRLFEWDPRAVGADGKMTLPQEAHDAAKAYAEWVRDHRLQLPDLINVDDARDQFLASYPFHPMVLSVFERKWSTLPRFQRTRGILRVLALWVSKAWETSTKKGHADPLITLGTAPLDDLAFRTAVFEQLGENRLEAAVTTDIAGRKDSHSPLLDAEAVDAIKKGRLHRKAATVIFFESNGGQRGEESKDATVGEVRLALGDPETDIGNIDTVLEALGDRCYYLTQEKNRYRFSIRENLNKRYSDRKATINPAHIDEEVKAEVQRVFNYKAPASVERVYFPEKSSAIVERPVLTFAIGWIDRTMQDGASVRYAENLIRENGSSARTLKSAVFIVLADAPTAMREDARKLKAWETIRDEILAGEPDSAQLAQVKEHLERARRDLRDAVWRSYKHVLMLAKDNSVKSVDLSLHASAGDSPISAILEKLKHDDEVTTAITPNTITRNWPPAFTEWSTKSVRDAFYSSPLFPRILDAELVKDAIAKGVSDGRLGYVQKNLAGEFDTFVFGEHLGKDDVEFSDAVFVIQKATAEKYKAEREKPVPPPVVPPGIDGTNPGPGTGTRDPGKDDEGPTPPPMVQPDLFSGLEWEGEVSPQKWMLFYNKVVARLNVGKGLRLQVKLDATPEGGVSKAKIQEAIQALQELGLSGDVKAK